jgi:hypothetical protein
MMTREEKNQKSETRIFKAVFPSTNQHYRNSIRRYPQHWENLY